MNTFIVTGEIINVHEIEQTNNTRENISTIELDIGNALVEINYNKKHYKYNKNKTQKVEITGYFEMNSKPYKVISETEKEILPARLVAIKIIEVE